jgi:hypothetical protein
MTDAPDFIPADQMESLQASEPASNPLQSPSKENGSDVISQDAPDFIPADDFISDEEKYSTTGQQLKTGAEGLSKGLIGSIPTEAIETNLLGVKPEDIQAREEANPGISVGSQMVGFGAGMLTGVGEAGLALKAGSAASKAITGGKVLAELPMATRIGARALQDATEMAILTSDDEVAKMIWHKPEESAATAIGNIGLATALGGGAGAFLTGAVSPLWKATTGPKVEGFLSSLTGKMGGKADDAVGQGAAKALFEKAGLDPAIAPSVLAKIDGNETAQGLFSKLSQTDTTVAGRNLQKELKGLEETVGDKIATTFGKDKAHVESLDSTMDKYARGQKVSEGLVNELDTQIKPISEAYEAMTDKFKDATLSQENRRLLSDDLAKKAISEGWFKAADESSKDLLENVLNKLPKQENANDLKLFLTNLRESHPYGSPTYKAYKEISNSIRESQERAVIEAMGSSAAGEQSVAAYNGLRGQYKDFMSTLDNLNDHLHVGKYSGPQSFITNLREMATTNPEAILSRMSGATKADTLKVLEQFPSALREVKDYQIDSLLKGSRNAEGAVDARKFARQFEKLSPQVRDLVASPGEQEQLRALAEIVTKTNDSTHNWSNTARTMDKITGVFSSPMLMVASMFGHGGTGVLAGLASLGIKEGADAGRLSMLKFLGSDQAVNPTAFKSMVQFMDNVAKGEAKLNKAVSTVFKGGPVALNNISTKDLSRLNKAVEQYAADDGHSVTDKLVNSDIGHYLPNNQPAIAGTVSTALNYLKTLKPMPKQAGTLDSPIPPTKAEEARYTSALEIAQNPMIIMEKIKQGTLQVQDIQDIHGMYPAMYAQMQQKLMDKVVNKKANDEPVPYRTRISLSLFVGQPLDSTMQPMSIQAAQPKPQQDPSQQPNTAHGVKKDTGKLGKTNSSYQTTSQAAESNRKSHD